MQSKITFETLVDAMGGPARDSMQSNITFETLVDAMDVSLGARGPRRNRIKGLNPNYVKGNTGRPRERKPIAKRKVVRDDGDAQETMEMDPEDADTSYGLPVLEPPLWHAMQYGKKEDMKTAFSKYFATLYHGNKPQEMDVALRVLPYMMFLMAVKYGRLETVKDYMFVDLSIESRLCSDWFRREPISTYEDLLLDYPSVATAYVHRVQEALKDLEDTFMDEMLGNPLSMREETPYDRMIRKTTKFRITMDPVNDSGTMGFLQVVRTRISKDAKPDPSGGPRPAFTPRELLYAYRSVHQTEAGDDPELDFSGGGG